MITVEDKEEIRRLFYFEHRSVRWIARTLGHSRTTVRKALADASAPVYQRKEPRPSPKMSPFAPQIEQWLAENLDNPPKQHLTARLIHQLLREQPGFEAAESPVRRFDRVRRERLPTPLRVVRPGEAARFLRDCVHLPDLVILGRVAERDREQMVAVASPACAEQIRCYPEPHEMRTCYLTCPVPCPPCLLLTE